MVSDDVISNSSPVFSGRTEANLIVTITIAGISYNVMADESGNWKFTVPNNLPDGAYSYTVSVTDNAGNVSSSTGQVSVLAQSDSSTLLLTGGLDTTSDTGVTGDNITGCNKPVFTGTTAPEAEVTLTIGGKTYSTKADVNGRWNITVSDPLPEGSNPYTVQATASNGASGTLQGGVVIDTQAQEITVSLSSASDTGVKGDFITQVTTPTFNGTAEAGARLTLAIGSSVYTFAADASGRWSFTLPEQLQDGVHQYTLTATDIAGNICTGTGSVTIDTTGPELIQQIDPSNQILTGNMISNVQPTFSGKTEPGVRLTISIADNTYNVIVDDTGRWSFTVPMALENKIWDYQITATDLAGNQTTLKEQIVINHQESVANIPVTGGLNISTDSGIVGDKITNFKKISFTGITEPGATINLVIADKNYTGKADEQGNWIVYVEEELQDGTYDYIVTATGSAGATGIFNGYVTVDTCQPNANVALASGSDSGVKGDCITNITLPVLTGNTEPNTLVQINIGGVDYETISDNYGQWSVTIKSPLKEGDNIYTILVKDAAGNSSNATGILKIDTTSPSLSGIKFGDGFDDRCTNTYTPTIIGWGEAGATVDIIIGSRKHSVIVPDNRQWQFKVPKGFIAEGNKIQYITFVETDVAGNKTEQKIKFQFITEKPIINADISHSTDTDIIGDKITSNTKPILEGTVINTAQTPAQIAKAKVSVYIDGKEYNNISVDENGHWTFQLPQELSTGNTYNYTVSVTDFVGNKNTFESYITISALSCSLDAECITGQGANVETSNKTPTLSGTAHANSDLTVYLNNKQYTVKASVDGSWSLKIEEPLGDGKYDYKVTEKTTDGKTNTFNGYFIIDTKAPTNLTVEVEDSALGNATIANRPDLTLKGKTEALALVTIAVGGITYQTKADAQGNWSYTFDKNTFIINQPYNYTVTASDAAGNKISVNGVFSVDTITVEANIDTNSNSGDKNDNITNVTTPTIYGETAAGAKITLVIGGKTYTTTASSDGKWAITVDSLKDNTYNYIVTAEIDGKKNYASGSVVIDTATITPTAELDESSDTGIKHDNITNNSTPILTGQAEAGSTIKLTINGSIYTAIADAHGNWSIKITYPLWEGVNEYTLQAEDKAGNFSDILTGHIILDSKLDVPTATLVESDNSGDQSDNITNISMPSLTGLAEPGATVTIKISDHIYSTIANTDGTWTVQVTNPLNEGVNHYEVEVQDNAGNTQNLTGDIVLDTTKPTLTDVKIADQIASEHDNVTVQNNPVFTGKVDDNTETVSISFGEGTPKYLVKVEGDGHWSYQHNSPFTPGEHQFTVEVSDKAGNTSSSTYDFEVIPPEQVPVPLDEQRLPVEIEGTALSGAQVELLIDNELYSTQVDSTGKWNVLTNSYTPGKYDYELKITHPSGETITDKGKVDIINKPLAIDNHHESLINTSAKVDDSAFIHSALEDVYINHQEQE